MIAVESVKLYRHIVRDRGTFSASAFGVSATEQMTPHLLDVLIQLEPVVGLATMVVLAG